MPVNPSYPGVYVQEISSSSHTIAGVSTANTAFVDIFEIGPIGTAQRLTSFADFQRYFGGLDSRSESSYQIMQYFLNGGSVAFVVRVVPASAEAASVLLSSTAPLVAADSTKAQPSSPGPKSRLRITAANPGSWGNKLRVAAVRPQGYDAASFALVAQETDGQGNVLNAEAFPNLSFDPTSPAYFVTKVNAESLLVRASDMGENFAMPSVLPCDSLTTVGSVPGLQDLDGGLDGVWDTANGEFAQALVGALTEGSSPFSNLAPDLFNILCVPATATLDPTGASTVMHAAESFCQAQRAFYIADIPNSQSIPNPQAMATWFAANLQNLNWSLAALYYPRLNIPDSLNDSRPREVSSSGTLAGLYASNDAVQGVWKAPAGTQLPISGATPVFPVQDADSDMLNSLGVNTIRSFPDYGVLSWGSRTLSEGGTATDEWNYIPVRRTALYIESSLYTGLQWVVFEPNAQPLWDSISLAVNAFMNKLAIQGAFQGSSSSQAYFVNCGSSTTTQANIEQGIVNVIVGFAPLVAAEFVTIQIQLHTAASASQKL